MQAYPTLVSARRATITRDLIFAAGLAVALALGAGVYASVQSLTGVTADVRGAGKAVDEAFDDAARAVRGAPLVGGRVADGLREAGSRADSVLKRTADRQDRRIGRLAIALAGATTALVAALVAALYLPGRMAQVRRMTSATAALLPHGSATAGPTDVAVRREVLATRAAVALPYELLLRHTRDPFGDLAARRHDALLQALFEHAGMAVPAELRRRM